MKCCGKERISNYCPDCGEKLAGDNIKQIIRYFQEKLNGCRSMKKQMDFWDAKNPDKAMGQSRRKKMESRANDIKKFEAWVNCLETLSQQPYRGQEATIKNLSLSVRARTALEKNSIATLSQVSECYECELLGMRGIGPSVIEEIGRHLCNAGMDFKQLDQ